MNRLVLTLAAAAAGSALAGGSNYNVAPGALAEVKGNVTEWSVPTPKFARDPAPDGSLYITVMQADRIARFDPVTHQFREWPVPSGAKPHGLLVDKQGIVYYTGNGTIGRLDPASGKVTEYKAPTDGGHPLPSGGGGGAVTVDGAGFP